MSNQDRGLVGGGVGGGGGGSPTNPDSTCQGEEMSKIKLEARLQAMEDRLLQNQETRFKEIIAQFSLLPGYRGSKNPEQDLDPSSLEKNMLQLSEKIDFLMSGENETNKFMDKILPCLNQVDAISEKIELQEKKLDKFQDQLEESINVGFDDVKGVKKLMKDVVKDTESMRKDLREMRDQEKFSRELIKSNNKKLDVVERQTRPKRRRSSGSESSDGEGRKRSRSSSESRSKRRGSWRRGRSRDTSISSFKKSRGNDMEKLLVQINDSIGVLADKVEQTSSLSVLQSTVVPQLSSVRDILERGGPLLSFPTVAKWDEDASPSPLRKPPGTPSGISEVLSVPRSTDRSARKTKKKRKRSSSSSSSSSEDEDMEKNSLEKNIALIGTMVSKVESRLKDMGKSWKKNSSKVEEITSATQKHVGDMGRGIQLIAENVDSMNDISKRLERIDDIKDVLEDLETIPKQLSDMEHRIGGVYNKIDDSSKAVSSRVRDLEGYLDGSRGRKVSTDEYGDITILLGKLEDENSKKFCEFGGLVEATEEKILKKLERMDAGGGGGRTGGEGIKNDKLISTLLEINEKLIDCVKNVDRVQKHEVLPGLKSLIALGGVGAPLTTSSGDRIEGSELGTGLSGLADPRIASVVPDPRLGSGAVDSRAGAGVSDHRLVALTVQLSQLQPRLDDLYTRVMPSLDEIKIKMKKAEEKGKLSAQEDTEHIQKILDIVEDLREEKRLKLDHGLPDIDVKSLIINHGEKLDDIYKSILSLPPSLRTDTENLSKVGLEEFSGSLSKLSKLSEVNSKVLDTLMKNSDSDAKTISNLNTSLQSMKASVNGVNMTAKELKETLHGIESKVTDLESSSVAVETKLQTEIISSFGVLKDEIRDMMEKTSSPPNPEPTKNVQISKVLDLIEKLVSKVTHLETKLNTESSNKLKLNKSDNKALTQSSEKIREELDSLGKELKSQMDDVHDMVSGLEEKTNGALLEIKTSLGTHDKNTGFSVNKIAILMQNIFSHTKQISEKLPEIESNLKPQNGDNLSASGRILAKLEEVLTEYRSSQSTSSSSTETHQILSLVENVELLNNKQDKLGKVLGRVKFLLESEDGEKEKPQKKKVGLSVKTETVSEGSGDISGLEKSLSSFRSSVEDELNNHSDLLTDITNQIQEISDKVATREGMKSIAEEIRHRMNDVCTGMTDLVGLVKDIPDQYTAGSALLEENLAASIVASLRDENQKHFDGINDALFEMENKLHGIKKLVKKGGGGGEDGDELGWKNVMERVECVSGRLESVQGVLENSLSQEGEGRGFDVALVLTEVRKRAESDALDRLSQDMFKAIHNVQRRLLEEHKRLINRVSEVQTHSPDPGTIQLLQTLNKIRVLQSELVVKQDDGLTSQEETNRLLTGLVDNLEKTRQALRDEGGGQMGGRMADLCEELASAVAGLITVQNKLSQNTSYESLDTLLRAAAGHLNLEKSKPSRTSSVVRGKRRAAGLVRRGDSSSPTSDPSSLDLLDPEQGWEKRIAPRSEMKRMRAGSEDKMEEEITEVSDEVLISPVGKKM